MRDIAMILLFLKAAFIFAQEPEVRILTLNNALNLATENSPAACSDSIEPASETIKSAWHTWLFRIHKYSILTEFEKTLGDLERIATLRYRSGEEDLEQTYELLELLYRTRTEAAVTYNEITICQNIIEQHLSSGCMIVPADSTLAIYEIDKSHSSLIPDVTDSATIHAALIRNSIIENKQLELDNLFIRLQYYQEFALDHADVIEETSRARYKAEDIGYTELITRLSEAFRIRLEYVDLLNQYNQSAIQLEYYAYKNK